MQSKILTFAILCTDLYSPEDYTNKEISAMIGEIAVTVAKVILADIRDLKRLWQSI